jgi:hypothetical protein
MYQFTPEDTKAIDELAFRFFDSSYGRIAASNQIHAVIRALKVAEARYQERMRVAEKGGRDA